MRGDQPVRDISGMLLLCVRVLCGIMLYGVAGVTSAASPIVYVANNGVDSANCGTQSMPCRSITRGMARAPSGSIIVVGPGRYGDLNGDGKFDSPGEERPQKASIPSGGGWPLEISCVVCILKPVHLVSSYGAESTLIDAGHAPSAMALTAAIAPSSCRRTVWTPATIIGAHRRDREKIPPIRSGRSHSVTGPFPAMT